jgi:hypothetical protein
MSFNLFLIRVFQWFLISLSVRPGKCAAILDHLHKLLIVLGERNLLITTQYPITLLASLYFTITLALTMLLSGQESCSLIVFSALFWVQITSLLLL